MNEIGKALHELNTIDAMAKEDKWLNQIHPLVKLILTIFYITVTVSIPKYDMQRTLSMLLYPLVVFVIGEIPVKESLYRLRVVLPLVCIVGILNPFFDHTPITRLGNLIITGGIISMLTLMIKGVLTVLASYLLIATTSVEKICYALQLLHLPKIFVVQILLIFRYITVLLREAKRVMNAYMLRAPGQKGIAFEAWGPLLGQMLLRSMDRAEVLYQSMCVRGFQGEFHLEKQGFHMKDACYFLFFAVAILLLRIFPVFYMVGSLL